jgi:hypothetical protein
MDLTIPIPGDGMALPVFWELLQKFVVQASHSSKILQTFKVTIK